MRKVHLLSGEEPFMIDLAFTLCKESFEVSISSEAISPKYLAKIKEADFTCYGNGWFPEKLSKEIVFVVLGSNVKDDNPELKRAKELGLLILSIPEFICHYSENKTRVAVAGTHGKGAILSMISFVLQKQKFSFDYFLTKQIDSLPNLVKSSSESRVVLIDGDEQSTSNMEKGVCLEFYRPNIAVLTTVEWPLIEEESTLALYLSIYKRFVGSIARDGKFIFVNDNQIAPDLTNNVREDITVMGCEAHEVKEEGGFTYLPTRHGDFRIYVPNKHFLLNLNAALLVCRQLGVKDTNFYQAISDYSLSLQP
jgi:UDP-N-acetylmuramate-alanine ligase